MRFHDIDTFPLATYEVDQPWRSIEHWLDAHGDGGVDLDPDFQRGHVWTRAQQVAFVEYSLRGGKSARNIYFNNPDWHQGRGATLLIDGKQRLEAARAFLRDEVRVFGGRTCTDLGGVIGMSWDVQLRIHIHRMATRADVLRWYIAMNSGGSAHSPKEVARVRALLAAEESHAEDPR